MGSSVQSDLWFLVEWFAAGEQAACLLLHLAIGYCLAGTAETTCHHLNVIMMALTFIPEQEYNSSQLWVIHLATTLKYMKP